MKTIKNKKAIYSTKWIAYTAILTALVVATGYIPPIATPAGRIYWVDGVVLLAAYLMDPLSAFICGGVGTLIYDVFKSPEMMLASLLIHGLQGAIVSGLLHFVLPNRFKKYEWVKALIISVIAAVEVVLGYFIYRCITRGVPAAAASIPRNIIQEPLKNSLKKQTFCPISSAKFYKNSQRLNPPKQPNPTHPQNPPTPKAPRKRLRNNFKII